MLLYVLYYGNMVFQMSSLEKSANYLYLEDPVLKKNVNAHISEEKVSVEFLSFSLRDLQCGYI